ncbi:uncharacterized protein L969DRAFT_89991 [Mixia osmundae IAM 14324]|uniref:Protein CSN12 homolog n=1 Tax=Mixia osmundae (strain CBS 9802 / IAM 14324 / JCM 22182 / KY 12970) TaxID=764103 RepID=G7DUS7_MIXOS|nr:uncharacterized protein L969DRAFT_89991 [Mixia osmundae IAM 14324]KEI37445.1 hypothetical protein L969DRAFT_89991 [Mixia osmundae IAM 14324]GAA94337.1 hypothetical protein E5Q_00988 [Mixia osmundae IAM 14324]
MSGILRYGDMLAVSLRKQDGPNLALALDVNERTHAELIQRSVSPAEDYNNPSWVHQLSSKLLPSAYNGLPNEPSSPWHEMASAHIVTVLHLNEIDHRGLQRRDHIAAYLSHAVLVNAFMRWFSTSGTPKGWSLPVLYGILRDLRALAALADVELRMRDEKANKLEEASRSITKAFTACLGDRATKFEQSKRLGTYHTACLLFKTYFKLKTTALCKNIIRGIGSATDLPPLTVFSKADQITYRYYMGVFAFLREDYQAAESEFVFCFEQCSRTAKRNQELILGYLIPLRLLKGIMPTALLLRPFPALKNLYGPFITAYRRGDVKYYDEALQWAERRLVERSCYLIVERAREGCLRGFLKKTWLCSQRSTRMSIRTFQSALKIAGVDMESDEVECVIANMIYKGHMKGYISHEHAIVVLSAKGPFPPLESRLAVVVA